MFRSGPAAFVRALLCALLGFAAMHGWAAEVEMFSPQGEVKAVRQVAVRFSAPMVAFGDTRLADPFDIDCPEPGAGRWADHRNWVYDFARDLPAGVVCTFALRQDLRSLAGEPVTAEPYRFSTGGPAVVETLPYEHMQIEEEQAFILVLDAPVVPERVLEHAWCDATGIEERIGVRLLAEDDRRRLLDGRRDFIDRILQQRLREGRLTGLPRDADPEALRAAALEQLPLVVLHCARRLPAESRLRLVWGAGIESVSGVATSSNQVLEFSVRPAFTAQFSCQRAGKDGGCLPFASLRLSLSAPIARAVAQKIVLRGPERTHPPRLPDPEDGGEWVSEVGFDGPFREQAQYRIEIPADLRDDAGRRLSNQKRFPLTISTDAAPPLAKFPARFGIIEAKAAVLPVTLRDVEAQVAGKVLGFGDGKPIAGGVLRLGKADARTIVDWLKRVEDHQGAQWLDAEDGEPGGRVYAAERSILSDAAGVRKISVPKAEGGRTFEVVGIPLKQPGFYVVELASPKLGAALLTGSHPAAKGGEVYHVSTAALVTNLSVHFKQGRESSLVWVTTLDSGRPVASAQVSVQDCSGKEYWKGVTDAQGLVRSAQALPARDKLPGCRNQWDRQYVVLARHGSDVSFVMSDWDEGISRWRFNLPGGSYQGPYIATTLFDRTLVRAGETVHMKHLYRQHVRSGLRQVDAARLPRSVTIAHQGSDQRYSVPVRWSGGAAVSDWVVPKDAHTGVYRVLFEDTLTGESRQRQAGSFRVEEFRVPLMRASIEAPTQPVVQASEVPLGVQVSYLAGGGAADAPVKLRGLVRPRGVRFDDYAEFMFLNGAVREGAQAAQRYDWLRGEYVWDDEDESAAPAALGPDSRVLETRTFNLDGGGGGKVVLSGVPARDTPQELVAELEYRDPNGEVLTSATRVALWPAQVALGIRTQAWARAADQRIHVQAVALDLQGRPLAGVPVGFTVFERKTYSHRKRLLGGFYAYESGSETRRVQSVCEGHSDDKGLVDCQFDAPMSGELLVEASARDAAGRMAASNVSLWVAGEGDWWFEASDDDRMDVIPERKRYQPGEQARLQVRMPFRQASALVTVEREGVIDAFVTELSGKSPLVQVPLRGSHAPNVFVSVLAVRGRVADVQPDALVDLGKPAFKMGIAEIKVGWRAHQLEVKVSADKPVYRVREKAKIAVQVRRAAGGKPPPKGSEVTLVAVDEGLLELAANDSWNVLERMMQQRGLEVDTATASMQVVGKRHYGRKARPTGGGGGQQTARELFDTLLFWKARVKLDAQGRARVEVPLNDSLTSFRIVAVATGGAALFGTGSTSVRATRELMLFSGLPPLVREQDDYRALFTVRNASDVALEASVSARVQADTGKAQTLPAQTVQLAPGASQEVAWRFRVPVGAGALRWEVAAQAASEKTGAAQTLQVRDALNVAQQVIPAVPVRTLQATLAQVEGSLLLPLEAPAGAIAGRGGVQVSLLPRLAGELPGVREYMSAYPYSCLEQLASRAVALRERAQWDTLMAGLASYLDRDGFAKYFPVMREGSDVLTAYLLTIAAQAQWDIPEPARTRMQAALERFVAGQTVRDSGWAAPDLSLRKLAALQALARWGRAVQDNDLASLSIEPALWPTSALIDWLDLLQRAPGLSAHEQRMREATQLLRARLNFQGSTMTFSSERTDQLWWLMISGDVNANRMLLTAMELPQWRADVARLVRGSLGRQRGGHWDTTVANAWGVLALERFGAEFENTPVDGSTRGALAGQTRSLDWAAQPAGGEWTFTWPAGQEALQLAHQGAGKPWSMVRSLAAVPLQQPLFTGYRITRTVSALEQKAKGRWSRGDVLRVRLELEAQSDMSWVVVNDPLPAGASVLGSGLGRDTQILSGGEKNTGMVWPAFEERKFDSFRAYYRLVPKGVWTLEYSVRLNNPGQFVLPSTRVEALYAPEMFGELPLPPLVVAP